MCPKEINRALVLHRRFSLPLSIILTWSSRISYPSDPNVSPKGMSLLTLWSAARVLSRISLANYQGNGFYSGVSYGITNRFVTASSGSRKQNVLSQTLHLGSLLLHMKIT